MNNTPLPALPPTSLPGLPAGLPLKWDEFMYECPAPRAVRCINDGRMFESLGQAAKAYGICQASVSQSVRFGHTVRGGLRFEAQET